MSTRILNHPVINHPHFPAFLFAIIACSMITTTGIVPMAVIPVGISTFWVLQKLGRIVRNKVFLWMAFPVF